MQLAPAADAVNICMSCGELPPLQGQRYCQYCIWCHKLGVPIGEALVLCNKCEQPMRDWKIVEGVCMCLACWGRA